MRRGAAGAAALLLPRAPRCQFALFSLLAQLMYSTETLHMCHMYAPLVVLKIVSTGSPCRSGTACLAKGRLRWRRHRQ